MTKSSKFILGFFVYSFTIAVVLTVAGFWWLANEFTKPGPLQEPILFSVERGTHANAIAWQLFDKELIHDPYIFMIGVTILGDHTKLKAGEYQIEPDYSARDIVNVIRDGKTFQRRFTIPEGRTSYEIVQLLNAIEELSGDIKDIPPEGTLLPETYSYRLGEPRSEVITRLTKAMADVQTTLAPPPSGKSSPSESSLSTSELCKIIKGGCWKNVLTLASIVEKETGVAGERKRVAGVFINRLKRGIPLQTDPTVIYAITKGKHKNDGHGPLGRRLLRKDLNFDSPYNTYKNPGLPPGPIANPGRASIEAVLDPEEHDYIYFVADGTGGHLFAKTLAEHNRNVANWRKIRKRKKN